MNGHVNIYKLTVRNSVKTKYPGVAQLVAHLTGGQGVVSSSLATRTILNEIRFSNIFIEKRISHFLKALQLQGFFYLRSFNALMKKRKMQKDYFFAKSEFEHSFFVKCSSSNACGVLYFSVR